MRIKKSPMATAVLIVLNAKLYAEEKSREVSRYRFSRETLRRFSGREKLEGSFIKKVETELVEVGWILVELKEDFAVFEASKADSWVKLSSKRVKDLGLLELGEEELFQEFNDLSDELNALDSSDDDELTFV